MAQAIRFYETGSADVLRFEQVEVGDPGPGQTRVRHTCVAVNFIVQSPLDFYFSTNLRRPVREDGALCRTAPAYRASGNPP
jgi:hypothetical protein